MFPEIVSHIFMQIASPERLNVAMMALVIVCVYGAIFGSLSGNANPFIWGILDRILGGFARKTYKVQRSESSLRFRGLILFSLYMVLTVALALGAYMLVRHFPFGGFLEPILLTCVLSGGATWSALIKLHRALRAEQQKGKTAENLPKGSFYDIAVSTRTNLNTTDTHGIIRGAIGFVATSLDKGMVAPLFWYIIGGLPLAFLYGGVAAARWCLSKEGFAKGMGALPLKIEQLMGILPQIFTALILSFAALMTPSSRLTRSVGGMFTLKGRAPYAEGGLPLTIMAWGLGVSLGGPVEDIDGSVLKRSWVGSANSTAKVEMNHLRVAIYQSIMAHILTFSLILAGLMAWRLVPLLFPALIY